MTFKEIFDDLMAGVPFKRNRTATSVAIIVVVDVAGEKILAYRYGGATYQALGTEDLTATDWERA